MAIVNISELDAHEQPSQELKAKWKAYSKAEHEDLFQSPDVDDLGSPEKAAEFCLAGTIPVEQLNRSFSRLSGEDQSYGAAFQAEREAAIYYHPLMPGLSSFGSSNLPHLKLLDSRLDFLLFLLCLPPEIQKVLLRHLIHRDLSVPSHQTNLHLHFRLPYPDKDEDGEASFFSYPPESDVQFEPKNPDLHRPFSIKQVMERKLHWVTLGGQYDWTNRVYPGGEQPPAFPADVAGFLETLFPETLAQAAIVNFYTPGDTMMMHRDVSEETDKGLVSVSIGCDSLFMITPEDPGKMSAEERELVGGKGYLLLRVRSGDAIYMTKESRFAWHGVPKVLRGTCPSFLEDWPAEGGKYEEWRGWMRNKRINLNVRQMKD